MNIWKKYPWDVASWLLIILAVAVFVIYPQLFLTIFEDPTYHALTAQAFTRQGGLSLWENWSSLPVGRAHLYPPAWHLFLAFFAQFNLAPFTLIKLGGWLSLFFCLSLGWLGWRKLSGARSAFVFLSLICLSLPVLRFLLITQPASLVLFCCPLWLFLLKRQSWLAAAILQTLLFYTHAVFPWLILFSAWAWGLKQKLPRRPFFLATFIPLLLFLPWGLFNLFYFYYQRFSLPDYVETFSTLQTWQINLLFFLLALTSTIYLWRTKSWRTNPLVVFFTVLGGLSLLMILTEPARFFDSAGWFAAAALITLAIEKLLTKKIKQPNLWLFIGLIILIVIPWPRLIIDNGRSQTAWQNERSFFWQLPKIISQQESQQDELLIYAFLPDNLALAQKLSQTLLPNEPFLAITDFFDTQEYAISTKHYIPQFFSALSNRPFVNPRYPESTWQTWPPLQSIKVILADIHQTNLSPQKFNSDFSPAVADLLTNNFLLIGQSGRLTMWQNKNYQHPLTGPKVKVVLPLPLAWLIELAALFFISRELLRA